MLQSEQIATQIQETQTRLASIDTELEALSQALSLKAGSGEAYDAKSVVALEKDRSALQREREFLTLRLDALEAQRQETVKTEAAERVAAIALELTGLATESEQGVAEFVRLVSRLKTLVDGAAERRQRCAELLDEMRYHVLEHTLDSPSLPDLAILDLDPLRHLLREGQAALRVPTGSLWGLKLERLQDERNAAAKRQQPPQGYVIDRRENAADTLARQYSSEPRVPRPHTLRRLLGRE